MALRDSQKGSHHEDSRVGLPRARVAPPALRTNSVGPVPSSSFSALPQIPPGITQGHLDPVGPDGPWRIVPARCGCVSKRGNGDIPRPWEVYFVVSRSFSDTMNARVCLDRFRAWSPVPSKIVKFFSKIRDLPAAGHSSRAVARIGWRPCHPVGQGPSSLR